MDIRTIGSGTIGATNAARAFDGGASRLGMLIAVMAIDVAKGFAPTYVAMDISGAGAAVATGSAALLGNYRPVFLRFQRGGKIVATTGGVGLAVAPLATLSAAVVWIAVFLVTRYASLASMVAAATLPLFALLFDASWPVVAFTTGGALAIVLLHRGNIARLAHGQESKMRLRGPRRPRAANP